MKKIYSKIVLLFIFILIGFMAVSAQTVYTTKTGTKYHSLGCQYLARSSYATTVKDALAAGYSACSRCNPPAASQTIKTPTTTNTSSPSNNSQTKKSTEATQCTGTTKAGNRCKRMTTNPSGRCYQH
jgi:methylphosphotriester-DNA--protein-cysteine methyltransferase